MLDRDATQATLLKCLEALDGISSSVAHGGSATKFLPSETESGSVANFADGATGTLVSALVVTISSESPITGLSIFRSGADTSEYDEFPVSWEDVGGITDGTLDAVAGKLTTGGNTYDVDPVAVDIFLETNIWSDAGDVSVTYHADIQAYVEKKIQEATA